MQNLIVNSSGIQTWDSENIAKAPESAGAIVLRESPVNGFIISLEAVTNLKERLEALFQTPPSDKIKFFSWHATNSLEDAQELKDKLEEKFSKQNH